jgi:hypothetical protein
MKFSIGDKIKLRKTGEEGEVIDIVQDQYLRVRVNGVVIPAEEQDLDFPYLDWFLKDREEKKAQEKKRLKGQTVFIDNIKKDKSEYSAESLFDEGVYLLFQPVYREQDDEDAIHRFVVYLFSEWVRPIDYLVGVTIQGKSIFSFEGSLAFQQKQLLYSLSFDDASNNPIFDFEVQEPTSSIKVVHEFKNKLSRKKLIEQVARLEKENLALFEIPVFTKLKAPPKIEHLEIGRQAPALSVLGTVLSQRKAKGRIDLHIEKIHKWPSKLSDAEKLQCQLDYFQTYLDLAIADDRINPLRVIHGIGQGVLKKEIDRICHRHREVKSFAPEQLNPGVTLVFF